MPDIQPTLPLLPKGGRGPHMVRPADPFGFQHWPRLPQREDSESTSFNPSLADLIASEALLADALRRTVLRTLRRRAGPGSAGGGQISFADIERYQTGLLYADMVRSAAGVYHAHRGLNYVVTRFGICTTTYSGAPEVWEMETYASDATIIPEDDNLLRSVFLSRKERERSNRTFRQTARIRSQELLLAYALRMALLDNCFNMWLMGRGQPVPPALLYGTGDIRLTRKCVQAVQALVDHRNWMFVAEAGDEPTLDTLAKALNPYEYAIIDTQSLSLPDTVRDPDETELLAKLVRGIGDKIVRGVYRAAPNSSGHVFYSHRDYATIAAILLISDSVDDRVRGYPVQQARAEEACARFFSRTAFEHTISTAYQNAGYSPRYVADWP